MIARLRDIVNFLSNPLNSWRSTPSSIENGSETAPELPPNLPEGAETVVPAGGNSIACSAISSKISEVADAAESLDAALNGVQKALDDLDGQQSNDMEQKAASNHNSSTDVSIIYSI